MLKNVQNELLRYRSLFYHRLARKSSYGDFSWRLPVSVHLLSELYAKTHSLFVAVQTNGFYPTVIESMLRRNLIDKIFLDIKAPLSDEERYDRLAEASGVAERVKNTLAVCSDAEIDLELVTTVFKHLTAVEAVKRIAEDLEEAGAANCPYVIQQGRVELIPDNVIKEEDVFSMEELKELAALAYVHLNDVRIRTRDGGEEVIYR